MVGSDPLAAWRREGGTARGPCTLAEVADRTGTNERYARDWLEQQTVSDTLLVDDYISRVPIDNYSGESRRHRQPHDNSSSLLTHTPLGAEITRAFMAGTVGHARMPSTADEVAARSPHPPPERPASGAALAACSILMRIRQWQR